MWNAKPPSVEAEGGNGKAIAGMVNGIIGLLSDFIPFVGLIIFDFGMKSQNHGMVIAGLVMNILSLLGAR